MKAKKQPTLIDRFFLWINILFGIALLLSYLSPTTNPAKTWIFAFFGLAYPILLLLNILFLVYWLLRKSLWVLLPLICICVGWTILRNNIGLRFSSDSAVLGPSNSIRIMTYNVHEFKRYGSNNDFSTKHEILKIIEEQQPDIISFQEYYSKTHGQYDMTDTLKKILRPGYYYLAKLDFNPSEITGMAIFSKFPIIAQGMIPLTDYNSDNQCIYIDVKKGNKVFRVYNVHLQSVGFDEEDYKYLNKVSGTGKPDVHSTRRLGGKLKSAFIRRSAQVFKVKNQAATCTYPYIISGDFNDTPASFAVNEMSQGLKNAFREKGAGLGRTYNGAFPNYQIDYIMASQQFAVMSYKIIERKLSDHYPVRSDLVLK